MEMENLKFLSMLRKKNKDFELYASREYLVVLSNLSQYKYHILKFKFRDILHADFKVHGPIVGINVKWSADKRELLLKIDFENGHQKYARVHTHTRAGVDVHECNSACYDAEITVRCDSVVF